MDPRRDGRSSPPSGSSSGRSRTSFLASLDEDETGDASRPPAPHRDAAGCALRPAGEDNGLVRVPICVEPLDRQGSCRERAARARFPCREGWKRRPCWSTRSSHPASSPTAARGSGSHKASNLAIVLVGVAGGPLNGVAAGVRSPTICLCAIAGVVHGHGPRRPRQRPGRSRSGSCRLRPRPDLPSAISRGAAGGCSPSRFTSSTRC